MSQVGITHRMPVVTVLDYGAGNIRSLINALKFLGCDVSFVHEPNDIARAEKLIFPGVGAFGSAMSSLTACGYAEPLREYINQDRPFFGICLGMQTLFKGSDESPEIEGLGLIPAKVKLLDSTMVAVPHMGWNGLNVRKQTELLQCDSQNRAQGNVYFVHSFAVPFDDSFSDWVLTTTNYGSCEFVSAIQRGNVFATQFHPEKSGRFGLEILKQFIDIATTKKDQTNENVELLSASVPTQLARRVIACMDVRTNDKGDLVVTKGEQYDVREQFSDQTSTEEEKPQKGAVRNLGKPVELAKRYYEEGADEIVFLNITSFKNCPLHDLPMVEVLRRASEKVFVPLTVGGGIRDMDAQVKDEQGNVAVQHFPALEVASAYFRSGNKIV